MSKEQYPYPSAAEIAGEAAAPPAPVDPQAERWYVARAWYATMPGMPLSFLWSRPFQFLAAASLEEAARRAIFYASQCEPLEVARLEIFRLEAA